MREKDPTEKIKKLLRISSFPVGSIVQGKDKTFTRSYYEVLGETKDMLILVFRSYLGLTKGEEYVICIRPKIHFEIKENTGLESIHSDIEIVRLNKKNYKVNDSVSGVITTKSGKSVYLVEKVTSV